MIKTGRFIVVYDDDEGDVINPGAEHIPREEVESYMRRHPVPADPAYSKDDILRDLTESGSFYRLPDDVSNEMRSYIEDMLNVLFRYREEKDD